VRGKKLLDIGCGYGEDLLYFIKKGAFVSGVEQNIHFLELAKANKDLNKIRIERGSIYNLSNWKNYDICIANRVVDHLENIDKAFTSVHKTLKLGGKFIFIIAHPLKLLTKGYTKKISNYLDVKKSYFLPKSTGVKLPVYYRSLSNYLTALKNSGFLIEEFYEPKPINSAKKKFPSKYELFSKCPEALVIKAHKP